jgi:hypothetical protein
MTERWQAKKLGSFKWEQIQGIKLPAPRKVKKLR